MGESDRTQQLLEELKVAKDRLKRLEAFEGRHGHVEAALQDSELRYRVLYEENPSMYFTVDAQGTILSVNPFGADQLGFTVEELVGRPVLDVFHEEDKGAVRTQLKECVANPRKAFNWEFRKVRSDGALMWVREVARSVRDRDGRTVVFIVCEDITERKTVEQQLLESRERYRTLYTKTPVMLHSIDQESRLLDVSDHWLEVLGYEREEVLGRKMTDFLTEESKKFAERNTSSGFHSKGEARDLPYRFVKKNGEIVDVLLSAIAERDWHGTFVRSLAVLTDVTERKHAEAELRRSHEEMELRVERRTAELERQRRFLRQIIDVDPNFIFAKDREGRFTLVNQAVAEAYGTTVEDLIGKTDADFNPNKEEVEYFRRMDQEVLDTLKERFIPEEPITDSVSRRRWLQTVKRPLVDENGEATQVLGSATDITKRKGIEEKLRESESALRRSQRELRTLAGRLLTAQEDERRRLAREMHDDLTQRLAALSMQAGRLELRLKSPTNEVSELVARMGGDLRRLSSDVHALSRRLHPAILEDLGLVDGLAAECDTFQDLEGIPAKFDAQEVPPDIADATALCVYRIAQEALRNVAKHSGASEARVSLRGDSGVLVLTVEDRGTGFDKASAAGKGLGLASMEERARLVQAELTVSSQPGRGTTIRVRAPLDGAI